MTTTTRFADYYISQSKLAELVGKDRTTIRAYHSKGLRYRTGPRKTNEYHCSASFNWVAGNEAAKMHGFRLDGVEPLALARYIDPINPGPPRGWVEDTIILGGRMGYDETQCLKATEKIKAMVEEYNRSDSKMASIDAERLRLISERADALAMKNTNTRAELIEADAITKFCAEAITMVDDAVAGEVEHIANEAAGEDDPARCREILKGGMDRIRTRLADSFENQAQSYEDRANTFDDHQTAAG